MKKRTLGQVLKNRRATLGLTQRDLATKVNVKPSHVAYLETDRRRPSLALLGRIADVMGLEKESLFLLAHPEARSLINGREESPRSSRKRVWQDFAGNESVLTRYNVKRRELRVLSQVNLLGRISAPRQFLFILNAIRNAVEEEE
jgi:transcriptional regulator with XRE-family HTH domain